jgi:hypothetical protein
MGAPSRCDVEELRQAPLIANAAMLQSMDAGRRRLQLIDPLNGQRAAPDKNAAHRPAQITSSF